MGEADAADLGLALEHAIAGNAETQNTIKKYQLQVRDAQVKVDDESQAKSAAADSSNVNQSIAAARRKLESEFNQLTGDLDEMTTEAKYSEDKAARAMVDAARLADELRCEQEL